MMSESQGFPRVDEREKSDGEVRESAEKISLATWTSCPSWFCLRLTACRRPRERTH